MGRNRIEFAPTDRVRDFVLSLPTGQRSIKINEIFEAVLGSPSQAKRFPAKIEYTEPSLKEGFEKEVLKELESLKTQETDLSYPRPILPVEEQVYVTAAQWEALSGRINELESTLDGLLDLLDERGSI